MKNIKKITSKIFYALIFLSKYLSRYNLNSIISNYIQKKKMKNVLIIGSGGNLEKLIRNFKPDNIITIDINEKRKPDIIMDAQELKFEDQKFDYIFILEVLEHISNPFKAVEEIHRVLDNEGEVILSTPFCYGMHDTPNDYYRFTKFGIKKIFINYDEIFIEKRTGFIWTVLVLFARLIFSKKKFHKFFGIILLPFCILISPLAYLLDRFLPDDITTGYVAAFRKKS